MTGDPLKQSAINPKITLDPGQFETLEQKLDTIVTLLQQQLQRLQDLPGRKENINLAGELDGAPIELVAEYTLTSIG